MYVCVGCKQEMRCDKNSVGWDCGKGHVYPADRFRCPGCGAQILATNNNANFDPDYNQQDEYLRKEG